MLNYVNTNFSLCIPDDCTESMLVPTSVSQNKFDVVVDGISLFRFIKVVLHAV
jgi:hypothetical protein